MCENYLSQVTEVDACPVDLLVIFYLSVKQTKLNPEISMGKVDKFVTVILLSTS